MTRRCVARKLREQAPLAAVDVRDQPPLPGLDARQQPDRDFVTTSPVTAAVRAGGLIAVQIELAGGADRDVPRGITLLVDTSAYSGSVAVMRYKTLGQAQVSKFQFFRYCSYVTSIVSTVFFSVSDLYFLRRARSA